MVAIEFVDGTTEEVDGVYEYFTKDAMFIVKHKGYSIMYPREFVKSIRYIPVD